MNTLFLPVPNGWTLCADLTVHTDVKGYDVDLRSADGSLLVHLRTDGFLFVAKGYIHDGASGPAIDTDDVLLASLAHDVLYLLGRWKLLPWRARKACDITYRLLLIKSGVPVARAWLHYVGVRLGGLIAFGLFRRMI